MNVLNQYSYVFIALAAMAMTYGALRRVFRVRWLAVIAVQIVIFTVAIGVFLLVRPNSGNIRSVDQALQKIGNGKPTLVAFFSQFCTFCITLEPIVDQLEQERADEFNVLRIDIHSESGRQLRGEFGFSFTPEFVLYDAAGNEVWREHIFPTDERLDTTLALAPAQPPVSG